MEELQTALQQIIAESYNQSIDPELTRPDEQFGDYSTNAAMRLTKLVGEPPRQIAETLAQQLKEKADWLVEDVSIAGPGFINILLKDEILAQQVLEAPTKKPQTLSGQTVVAEYSDPNPFKILHAGHFYTSIVGYAVGSLMQAAGGDVHRVNFGGDVGLHVAKNMWAMLQDLGGEQPEKLSKIPVAERGEWMAKCYVKGNQAFENDAKAAEEIKELNKKVYKLHADDEHDSPFAQIYWTCRQWSYELFDAFYARIGTPFEKYYPESLTAGPGAKTVREHLEKGVYEKSDGAIVFKGEPYGLHTRVFINSQGIPTYETKDVGLIMLKKQDYNFDRSLVVTGNEQEQYMAVVLKSIEQFAPDLVAATTHLTHGVLKMKGGIKMSSRAGNILRAEQVLDTAIAAYKKNHGQTNEQVALDAIRYAFLKYRIGPDIIYDPEESVSLEGNSGPYIQYAHARARSILRKSGKQPAAETTTLQKGERSLARKISEYPEIVARAIEELMPHHICTYLYELAQAFNRFYEHNKVIGGDRETERLLLVKQYADVLKDGLELLSISAPEKL